MVDDGLIRKTFTVHLEGDNLVNVVFLDASTDRAQNKRQAQLIEDAIFDILNQDPGKTYKILVDITPIGGFNYISEESKEIYMNMAKLRQFQKLAVVGKNLFLEMIVNLIMQASGKDLNFKWFTEKQEALAWLNKE